MRHRKLLALFLPLALVACDDGDDDDIDSGTRVDSGMMRLDGGPPPRDSGTDAGPPQPRGMANPPALGAQIDRMGRPAIGTALNNTFNGDMAARNAAKDGYNADTNKAAWGTAWADDFRTSLAILDSLDRNCGNQLAADQTASSRYSFLAGVLADDQLYVDTGSGTCGTYLGHEAEVLGVVTEGGCGGRTPNDDVIERSYSVLAAGVLVGVDDTITSDDTTHSITTFPFLAAP